MSLIYTDGFDHYAATNETATNVTALLTAAGYTLVNANTSTLTLASGQDVGSIGVKLIVLASSATPPSMSKSFTTSADLIAFGFSFRGTGSRQRIARINGVIDLLWDVSTGKLKIGAEVGVDVIIMNAFWFIEIEIDKANNVVRVWANDALQLTADLPGGAVLTTHTILWGITTTSSTAATIEIDDFTVVDSNGSLNTARIGPVQIITRAPTSDMMTEWTPVNSTGSHFAIAAQLSPNAGGAPYLQANVEGKRDQFASTKLLPNDNQIFGVSLVSYSRKGDLDDRSLGMTMVANEGETEIEVPLTTGFAYRQAVFELAPGDAAWTQDLVQASSFAIVAR